MAGSARLGQRDGLQATANGLSKRPPNFHPPLPSTKAVPEVGNDKGFRVPIGSPPDRLRVAWGGLTKGWQMANGKGPMGRAGFARDAIPPVPPKTARSGPQPPKSAMESHLSIAEYFPVHGPVSTSEFAAVSTPPPRNNSLCYTCPTPPSHLSAGG